MRDWLIRRFPEAKREWAETLANEDASTVAAIRSLVTAWFLTLKGDSMRTVVLTLSATNAVAGVLLVVAWSTADDVPTLVLGLAGGMMAQGLFTVWVVLRRSDHRLATRLLLVGETLALLVGGGGLLVAMVNAIGAADPEYGPMTVAGLIGAHAVAGLYLIAIRDQSRNTY